MCLTFLQSFYAYFAFIGTLDPLHISVYFESFIAHRFQKDQTFQKSCSLWMLHDCKTICNNEARTYG